MNRAETKPQKVVANEADKFTIGSTVSRHVKFVRTPNVYFIGSESLAPGPVLAEYMDYDPQFDETLEAAGYRVVRNLFSEYVPTKRALNSLVALDNSVMTDMGKKLDAFSGMRPAPLIQIFRKNGLISLKMNLIQLKIRFENCLQCLQWIGIKFITTKV